MKETFKERRFTRKNLEKLKFCNQIIEEFAGRPITLRQLFYRLVTRNLIKNADNEYRKLSDLVGNAREAGKIDWDIIEDRVRLRHRHSEFESVSDLVKCAARSFRLPRWRDQNFYIEVHTEKDAMASILLPIADKWHVHFIVNRGNGSKTFLYDTARRFISAQDEGRQGVLFYLGDHDPSGLMMIDSIKERLERYGAENVGFRYLALTIEQVREMNLPNNTAKGKDPRTPGYIEKFGPYCWEIDALPPDYVSAILDKEIAALVDKRKMKRMIDRENRDRKKFEAIYCRTLK